MPKNKQPNSRAKGAAAEREVISEMLAFLKRWFPSLPALDIRRNLVQYQTGGSDLVLHTKQGVTPVIGGYVLEIKRVEKEWIESWWSQATAQAESAGGLPVVIHKRNRKGWQTTFNALTCCSEDKDCNVTARVTVPLDAWLTILGKKLIIEELRKLDKEIASKESAIKNSCVRLIQHV